ncbi:MAG TPA: zinc ribbon domain-containing protein [Ktedonobacterales bacterium]
MSTPEKWTCSRCGLASPAGTRYCPRCGEALDPALVAELRWLYAALADLALRIAQGKGTQSIASLHDEYRERYLALRKPPPDTRPETASAPPAAASVPATPATPATPPAEVPLARQATPAATPPPSFSWQAFVADQAIALMAYLGGFLLLIATLTFEVGAWQITSDPRLDNQLKLVIVGLVYVLFGALGVALRRVVRLHTVGRAYLGVFALMTPLVGLAGYLFELRSLGVPVAGMLAVSSFYATVVYLALAGRTHLATYAYLGWTTFLVGALAVVQWAAAPGEWSALALGIVSCVLLVPHLLRRQPVMAEIAGPARHLGVLTSPVAALMTLWLFIGDWAALAQGITFPYVPNALAAAACVLAPLAAGWRLALRAFNRTADSPVQDVVEVLASIAIMVAILSLAIAAGAEVPTLASILASLSVLEMLSALAIGWRVPSRVVLRRAMEGLALAAASVGALTVLFVPAAEWPLLASMAAGMTIACAIAVRERAPRYLLAGAPYLLVACARIGSDLRAAAASGPLAEWLYALRPELLLSASLFAFAALALISVGLVLATLQRTRAYAPPLYLVAFAAALIAAVLLPFGASAGRMHITPHADYQTVVLGLFLVAALAVGARASISLGADLAVGLFGPLLPWPYMLTSDGLAASGVALGLILLSLLVRVAFRSRRAHVLYVVALAAAIVTSVHAAQPGVSTASASWLGISFAAGELLVVSALALVAAVHEESDAATIIPALLAVGAVYLTRDPIAAVALTFAIVAVGAAFALWRGRVWGLASYGAAFLASFLAVPTLGDRVPHGAYWQVGVLLALALLAYLLSLQAREALGTALTTFYGLWAALTFPASHALVAVLGMTIGAAIVATVLRLRLGRTWALALYCLAIGASLVTLARAQPYDAQTVEMLLLAFIAIACVLAAIERTPVAGLVPCVYAIWAVILQPSAHTLLVFALAGAAVGVALGRVAGARWSLPWYLVAAVAGLATGLRSTPETGFEAVALLALALTTYAIAAVESLPDVLPLAFLLGALSLGAAASWAQLLPWQTMLAYSALSYLYFSGRWLWRAIPWLRSRDLHATYRALGGDLGDSLWTALHRDDPRSIGEAVHVAASFVLALGTALVAVVTLDAFSPASPETQAVAIALVAAGGLFAASARLDGWRIGWYAAGELLALAITWEARWFGADNLQFYVVAPASYQLLIGALLSQDKRVRSAVTLSQWASLLGALLLLMPSLYQAFTSGQELLYGLIMILEALVVVLVGVGLRMRVLVLVGAAFVGIGAIRGAMLAISDGAPIAAIIGGAALLLMACATWLSLRNRQEASSRATSEATDPTVR